MGQDKTNLGASFKKTLPLVAIKEHVPYRKGNKQVTIQQKIANQLDKFSFATKAGKSTHNRSKQNQDVYITKMNLLGFNHIHFFAVCDGHGNNGQAIAHLL